MEVIIPSSVQVNKFKFIGHSIQFQHSHSDVIINVVKSSVLGSIVKPDLYMNYLCDRENAYYSLVCAQKMNFYQFLEQRSNTPVTCRFRKHPK